MNRHNRRALATLARRLQRDIALVRRTNWGSPVSNEARIRVAALDRRIAALVGTETI